MSATIFSFPASSSELFTQSGTKEDGLIRLRGIPGFGVFGPYIKIPAGRCVARIMFRGSPKGRCRIEITSDKGQTLLGARSVDLAALNSDVVELVGTSPTPRSDCEVRLQCEAGIRADIITVEIETAPLDLSGFQKINFGCGYDKRDDHLNIDVDPACSPDLLIQDNDYSMIPKGHFEAIRAWDVLEHIPRSSTLATLLNWAEFLRIGGQLTLQTSSILGVANLLTRTNRYAEHHNCTIFLYGNQAHGGDFHLTGFTDTTLRVHLAAAGFEVQQMHTRGDWLFFAEARKTSDWTALANAVELDTPQFVNAAYVAALGRDPEEENRRLFAGKLLDGEWSRRDALRSVFQTPERLFKTAERLGF
jgi:hypothetical protein